MYTLQENYKSAIEVYLEALEFSPENPEVAFFFIVWGKSRMRCGPWPDEVWAMAGEGVGHGRRRCGPWAEVWAMAGGVGHGHEHSVRMCAMQNVGGSVEERLRCAVRRSTDCYLWRRQITGFDYLFPFVCLFVCFGILAEWWIPTTSWP